MSEPSQPTRPPRRSSAERDEELRARLTPYAPDERPWPLVAGAIVAALLGLANLVAYVAGDTVNGKRPAASGIIVFCALMFLAAWGMWTKRYWAVLGFQALLAIIAIVFFLFLLRASTILDVVIALALIVPSGTLFWKLVRVLARLQTPERPGHGDT
jgi:hypothetical protein